tara:strand:- start:2273 stop:2872 length:600 start_codon:yes stop_codon:yes gene_type:complete
MSKRSQLNVILHPSLISKVKTCARRKGLSISEYISNLVSKEELELDDNEIKSLNNRLLKIERHIDNLKSNCPGQLEKNHIQPFTKKESVNCTNFMRAVFKKMIEVKGLKNSKSAWKDFLPHIEKFDSWDLSLTNRLKEVLLFEEPEPWSSQELNRLTKEKNCPCPIRDALVSWSNVTSIPDQQTICDQGEILVSSLVFQ